MSALRPTNDDSAIWDLWLGQFRLPVVNVNDEVGTFKALSEAALTTDALAAQLGVDARALAMHLAALCSMGLVEKRLGLWRATHLARTWLHPDGAGYWCHFTRHVDYNTTLRARLLTSLRTGKRPGDVSEDTGEVKPRSVEWERGTMSQQVAAEIANFMHAHSQAPALGAAAQGVFGELTSLMDVGCGSGVYGIEIARAHSNLKVVLMDLKQMATEAQKFIDGAGMGAQGRIESVDRRALAGQALQHLVASLVAVVVVVVLEIIHVQQNNRQVGPAPAGAVDFVLQHLVDQAPVTQAGQLVDIGKVGKLAPCIPQLAVAVPQRTR